MNKSLNHFALLGLRSKSLSVGFPRQIRISGLRGKWRGSLPRSFPGFDLIIEISIDGNDRRTLCSWGYQNRNLSHEMYDQFLQESISRKNICEGRSIHAQMIKTGFVAGDFLDTKMVIMYVKCGSLEDARQMFDKLSNPNTASFNALLSGYAENGRIWDARKLFDSSFKHKNVRSWNSMISGYVRNGFLRDARKLFDEMPVRDLISWNSIISAYAQASILGEALKLLSEMRCSGFLPDGFTFTSALSCCSGSLEGFEAGRQIHAEIVKLGFDSATFVGNSLVTMYVGCRAMDEAHLVFKQIPNKNVVSCNAMMQGYLQSGMLEQAAQLFDRMVERDVVTWTSLMAGYCQQGLTKKAEKLFQKMPERNVVSWTAMISGFARHGQAEKALELFAEMHRLGEMPNQATFSSVLSACADCAALQQGRFVHLFMFKRGMHRDTVLCSALIDMYAKCGRISDALFVFRTMPERNLVSWNALITGYAFHGHGRDVLCFFHELLQEGIRPNSITFLGVLTACRNSSGLLDEGKRVFDSMYSDHFLEPGTEHYACLVDLFGRAGLLDEAKEFIMKMPFEPDVVVCSALLRACAAHKNVEIGEFAAKNFLELETDHIATYVLLSNFYASMGRWAQVSSLRAMMKQKGIQEKPGCSWITVNNEKHAFIVGDKSHPQIEEIYETLKDLELQMEDPGHVPNSKFNFHDVELDQKERLVSYHSEKLAVAFGIMSTPARTPLLIIKNLCICSDCHDVIKCISKISDREITVRDNNRFHCFKDGLCSCSDYW